MKKHLFEILCPDGYVKNGFDKTKLKTLFANSMIVNYDKNTFKIKKQKASLKDAF